MITTNSTVKTLPDNAKYMDVVNGGHLLPKRKKYDVRHFRALVKEGYSRVDARWICICSNLYWHAYNNVNGVPDYMYSTEFLRKCKYEDEE